MIQRFEVSNFKNFNQNFVFDLTDIKNYAFNSECVENGLVSKGMIYGPNGCGKSNLGHAIFDIKTHLTDEKTDSLYNSNYLNADNESKFAEFKFVFQFGENTLEYTYRKKTVSKVIAEIVKVNQKEVISIDREISDIMEVDLKGAETLNRDLSNNNISAVKYIRSNTVLDDQDPVNQTIKSFFRFIDNTYFFRTVDSHQNVKNQASRASELILEDEGGLKRFEEFLKESGVECELTTIEIDGEERLAFQYKSRAIDFVKVASTGTLNLSALYLNLIFLRTRVKESQYQDEDSDPADKNNISFIFIDEFDAFYHHAASKVIVKELKNMNSQIILTTHNTSIMSNDLLRPDCYFIMSESAVKPMHKFTEKELRKAHNIEKMYRAGAFDE